MRLLISILFIIAISIAFNRCDRNDKYDIPDDNGSLLIEIESLSKYGIELPEKVTPEDIEKCDQAVNMARAINNKELEIECLIRLIELHGIAENYREALDVGGIALELAIDIDDEVLLAHIYKLLGKNYYHLASFNKAFKNLEIALKLYQELNDTINIQDVMNLQGNIYFSYYDYDMAYSYYNQNLEISRLREDNLSISKALTNIGLIYSSRSNEIGLAEDSVKYLNEQAIEYIKNALLFIKRTNQKQTTAQILSNLADVYRSTGDYEKALVFIKDAMQMSKDISNRDYFWSCISYANILVDIDSLENAKQILIPILELSKENDLKEALINVYSILSYIYASQEEFEKAYYYYEQYNILSESIYNTDQKKKIDAIKIASDLDAQEKQQELKDQQRFYRILTTISMLLVVLAAGLLLYSRLRERAKTIALENRMLNESIETKNKELTTRIMELIQRSEVDKDIVQKLNSLKPKLKVDDQKQIFDVVRTLSSNKNSQLWKELEIRFESVHQEFYDKLARRFPDLTTNEKRLCAFLYRDMSSKDISAITGQSVRALNVARTRLRKRFDLTNDSQSISGFLNSM